MKVLVAFATKHGSTREIAESITGKLRQAEIEADLLEVQNVSSVDVYDAIVLGSAIYAGNWLPKAKQFAERFHTQLSSVPVWLFSSGPLGEGGPKDMADPARIVTGLAGVPVRDHKVFPGTLNPADLGFIERMMVKAVKAPAGDYRDWVEVKTWAREIGEQLQSSVPMVAQ